MAKPNISGASFCGWGLEKQEDKIIIKHLKSEDISAKRWLKKIIRKELSTLGVKNKTPQGVPDGVGKTST